MRSNPRLQPTAPVRRKEEGEHFGFVRDVTNDCSHDALGFIHMNCVELFTVLPAAMDDFGSDGVAALDLVMKSLLVFRILCEKVGYAVAQALSEHIEPAQVGLFWAHVFECADDSAILGEHRQFGESLADRLAPGLFKIQNLADHLLRLG